MTKKIITKGLGYILSLVAIYLLFQVGVKSIDELEPIIFSYDLMFVSFFLILLMLLGQLNLVWCWSLQLEKKYPSLKYLRLVEIIARSQIAKYLPGNMGHLMGRIFLAQPYIKKRDTLYTLFWESILLVIPALLLGSVYVFSNKLYWVLDIGFDVASSRVMTLVFVLLVFSVTLFVGKYFFSYMRTKWNFIKLSILTVFKIISFNVSAFCLHGLAIFLIADTLPGVGSLPSIIDCITGFALAFMVGYILPGAPGGLGVREYAFVLLYSAQLGEIEALQIILVYRILSIVTDIIFFGIGLILNKKLSDF